MSRKLMLTLAAAAAVAATTLTPGSGNARGFGGGMGGGHMGAPHMPGGHASFAVRTPGTINHPRIPRIPIIPIHHPHHPPHWFPHPHHHHHWVFRGGRWIVDDEVLPMPVAHVATPAPGPCTCLTKTYTPNGLVVFADVCTKESASATVEQGRANEAANAPTSPVSATAVPISKVPTAPNYAGRTYEDYLAAIGAAVPPQADNGQSPSAASQPN